MSKTKASALIIKTLSDFESDLREAVEAERSDIPVSQLSERSGVSRRYFHSFLAGDSVCIKTLNSIANHLDYPYAIGNVTSVSEAECIGIHHLSAAVRRALKQGNVTEQAVKADVSKQYIYAFMSGQEVCVKTLMQLAESFDMKFVITNF